jgi:hypothetical protein
VPGRLEEVADGVFAYVQPDGSWMINKTGFLVARDGVTAVDACSTERRTQADLGLPAGHARMFRLNSRTGLPAMNVQANHLSVPRLRIHSDRNTCRSTG